MERGGDGEWKKEFYPQITQMSQRKEENNDKEKE